MTAHYEVEKFGRDGNGRWFGFGARRFASLEVPPNSGASGGVAVIASLDPVAGDEFRVDVGRSGTWETLSVHPTLPDALDAYDVTREQLSDSSAGWRHLRIVRNGIHIVIRWDLGRP